MVEKVDKDMIDMNMVDTGSLNDFFQVLTGDDHF